MGTWLQRHDPPRRGRQRGLRRADKDLSVIAAGSRFPPPRKCPVGLYLRGIQDRRIDAQRITGHLIRRRKLL
ncbi:hypothetical protein BL254_23645 [Protofrankia sp. BMG5.30]|uniref:Transposase n=1 Tax=Protofrankia coriariae TaxID=1562887 RepID=A0ABR5EYP4_9ACTN|nr:hypothetical protein FrCorBMG51_23835 [Protofrankia coriariae]ONH31012.1 hypothetical protein BL254_23645 [Protofrankia sp. BMG5.30]